MFIIAIPGVRVSCAHSFGPNTPECELYLRELPNIGYYLLLGETYTLFAFMLIAGHKNIHSHKLDRSLSEISIDIIKDRYRSFNNMIMVRCRIHLKPLNGVEQIKFNPP